jgi:hypothetical protein
MPIKGAKSFNLLGYHIAIIAFFRSPKLFSYSKHANRQNKFWTLRVYPFTVTIAKGR